MRLAAVLAVAAIPAAAGEFDGVYKQTIGSDCTRMGVDGGALVIRENVLFGIESRCEMEEGERLRGLDAVLYDMACTAEGVDWTAPAILMHAAEGGLILVWRGYAFAYDRCPEGLVPVPRVRPLPRPEKALAR